MFPFLVHSSFCLGSSLLWDSEKVFEPSCDGALRHVFFLRQLGLGAFYHCVRTVCSSNAVSL